MTHLTEGDAMNVLTVKLYGGEDYRLYDGERLVATVYAEADLHRFVPGYGDPNESLEQPSPLRIVPSTASDCSADPTQAQERVLTGKWKRGIGNDSHRVFDEQGHYVAECFRPEDGTRIVETMNAHRALQQAHERVVGERDKALQVIAGVEAAIAKEFAKKDYTDEDRAHRDVLENMGVFLDHHQELEQQLAAARAFIEKGTP